MEKKKRLKKKLENKKDDPRTIRDRENGPRKKVTSQKKSEKNVGKRRQRS